MRWVIQPLGGFPAGLVAAVLALAGCGGTSKAPVGGGSGATAAPINACLLLPPEEVRRYTSDAAGTLSSTLDDAVGRDPAHCTYSLAGTMPPRVVSLEVRQAESAERAASLHRAAESGLASLAGGTEPVAGLGDHAFWVDGKLDQLHVLAGNRQLIFTVQLDHNPKSAARDLAARALARMNTATASTKPAPPRRP